MCPLEQSKLLARGCTDSLECKRPSASCLPRRRLWSNSRSSWGWSGWGTSSPSRLILGYWGSRGSCCRGALTLEERVAHSSRIHGWVVRLVSACWRRRWHARHRWCGCACCSKLLRCLCLHSLLRPSPHHVHLLALQLENAVKLGSSNLCFFPLHIRHKTARLLLRYPNATNLAVHVEFVTDVLFRHTGLQASAVEGADGLVLWWHQRQVFGSLAHDLGCKRIIFTMKSVS